MKIANADKLINHFENTIAVHLFTTAEIITIINTFSVDVPDGSKIISANDLNENIQKSYLTQGEKRLLCHKVDKAPDIFGGAP